MLLWSIITVGLEMILIKCGLCVKIGETFANTLIYDLKKLSIAPHYDPALYDCIEF